MQRQYIACEPALCTGCQICELVCSFGKEGAVDLERARIRVARPQPVLMLSIACRLCEGAPCVAACPRDALHVSEVNGTIVLDQALCTGCGWCIEACDFGAIALDRDSKSVVICDLCQDLPAPRCVANCPKKALSLASVEQIADRARLRLTEALLTLEQGRGNTE